MKARIVAPLLVVVAAGVLAAGPASHAQNPPVAEGLVTMTPKTAGDRTTLAISVTTAGGASSSLLDIIGNPELVVFNERNGFALKAGEGCKQLDQQDSAPSHRVACVIDKKGGEIARTLSIALGDGSDNLKMEITGPDVVVDGGAGIDNLLAIDRPYPGYGLDDKTYPHPAGTVNGGPGDDTVTVRGRNFSGFGDAGSDTLYEEDAGAIWGGSGADKLTIKSFDGSAFGGSGNDVLNATKGNRTTLNGGSGDDVIKGSPTGDLVVGGSGFDSVLTGAGIDKVFVRDGAADRVNCGGDEDVVTADSTKLDKVVSLCERVNRPARKATS